jgi:hypothetical protein
VAGREATAEWFLAMMSRRIEIMVCKTAGRVLALGALFLTLVASAMAQDHAGLIGKWNMTSEAGDQPPVKWVLVLKDVDGKLAAFLATPDGDVPAKDSTYVDGVVKFKAPYQGQDYDIELKYVEDKLEGTWSNGTDSGKTNGVKDSAG